VPGELRLSPTKVRLDYTHPTTAYREKGIAGFDFDVIGDGFSTNPANDAVLVDGQGDIIADLGPPRRTARTRSCLACALKIPRSST
jgi:hypothetical protein